METIIVVGIWHLGIVNCVGFAEKGYKVIGLDFDLEKVKKLQEGTPPIYEPGLKDLLQKHSLKFTTDVSYVATANYVVIAYDSLVNENDEVDITQIINSSRTIAPYLQPNTLVIITSQVPLGSCEIIEKNIQKLNHSWKSGVVYTPENLKLGSAISRFIKPDMLVLGANNSTIHNSALQLYKNFETEKILMNLRSAEMVKHALNTFLATSITFINEIANLSDRLGADAVAVGKALKLDSRIGKSALMMPGLGFSGGTLARDVTQLRKFSLELNYESKLLNAIIDINDNTFNEILIKLSNNIGELKDKTIGILGLTYKPNTSTVRRSPAIKIIQKLNKAGARCIGYDPKASSEELEEYSNLFIRTNTISDLAKDAIILVTEWQEFKQIDFSSLAKLMNKPIIIDSKNYLDPETLINAGFIYEGFGR